MTPQSSFMVLAPVIRGREQELRELLASMNTGARAWPTRTTSWCRSAGSSACTSRASSSSRRRPRTTSRSMACRPSRGRHRSRFSATSTARPIASLHDLVDRAGAGLRQIFAHCRDFSPNGDLLAWMKRHEQPSAASYVNWIGRTVRQVREEQAPARGAASSHLHDGARWRRASCRRICATGWPASSTPSGRRAACKLTPPKRRRRSAGALRNALHAIGVPVALLVAGAVPAGRLAGARLQLRRREKADPEIAPRPARSISGALPSSRTTRSPISSPSSAISSPAGSASGSRSFLLWLLDYSARHIYNRGYLTRVQTIHFARWVFIDDRRRAVLRQQLRRQRRELHGRLHQQGRLGHQSGLQQRHRLPAHRLADQRGARDEQEYKRLLRRHQLPTDVWYKAYPGLTGGRSRAQQPDPRGHRAQGDDRQGGEGMAEPPVRARCGAPMRRA